MTMRTRFAPSPTGFLHIGGARTALFNHLHTRRHGGTTLLRVEDTDRERSTEAATQAILEGLAWLGLSPDEGPYFQSDFTQRHLDAAWRLVEEGKAYRCTCSKEEVDALREEQRASKDKPRYDGRCRDRTDHPEGTPFVLRFRLDAVGETVWHDMIQGTIRYPNDEMDDLILVRSDGSPTYNLAVVVDDHAMGITHVIRGSDHLSNTPRQLALFRAFGWEPPIYGHMPLLHGTDGAKLSKRHGAVSVLQYREEGFLPEAVNNYLARLGWSHGDQEFFTMEELERLFDVTEVGKSASVFNASKLEWLNTQHMKSLDPARLAPELVYHLKALGVVQPDPALAAAIIPTLRDRAKTFREMADKARFYFMESVEPYLPKAVDKHFQPEMVEPFTQWVERLAAVPLWEPAALEAEFNAVLEATGAAKGKLAQVARVALAGSDVSPGIFEVMGVLGRERALRRLSRGLEILRQHVGA
ncbi:MAG: glutamate--tRNA ligase [Magnetococcales bacterium]|nr:glutamate--tRNA ligase [Magnetococcales bacterium]